MVEPLLNGVFHNEIPEDDLVGQMGTKGFELWQGIPFMDEHPFFKNQKRVVLGNCGCYDPESIEEYIARGGYRSYVKAIRHYTFEEVCDIIERSGLRGRSGGDISQASSGNMPLTHHPTPDTLSAMQKRAIPVPSPTEQFLRAILTACLKG